jgi:hypothetical protein
MVAPNLKSTVLQYKNKIAKTKRYVNGSVENDSTTAAKLLGLKEALNP